MRIPRSVQWVLLLTSGLAFTGTGLSATQQASLASTLDSLARAHAANERVAGASVAVVYRGDTLLMRGYGQVDVEWTVATPADADVVYEIGSVTKQFTSTLVLEMGEEGKLDLDADITAYLPDYDTQGHYIPLRRLMDHTSGIKGYTEMPVFGELMTRELPRDSLVRVFEAVPLEFEPGTALIYNNSAYFLLGLILEKVSGETYESLVQTRLFDRLGMSRSSYCDEGAVVRQQAHGYDAGPDGLRIKGYLDHTWPYAAGSLCSTVGDLVRWNQALHGGRVLSAASYGLLTTPEPLVDGTPIRYAKGLGTNVRNGHRTISHGGGINGFLSDVQYFPDDDLLVVVLQNTAGPVGPGALSNALVEAVLGPADPPTPVAFSGDLTAYAGTFVGPARGTTWTRRIVATADGLSIETPGSTRDPVALTHVGGGMWVIGNTQFTFRMEDGKAVALHIDSVGGHYVLRRLGTGM